MTHLSEDDIRQLTKEAINQLGSKATPAAVEKIVTDALQRVQQSRTSTASETYSFHPASAKPPQNRIIVTAFGKNQIGILAGLTAVLAEHQCDIIDLTQKILQEFFTIMILVDISQSMVSFENLKTTITSKGESLGLKVIIQHEDIFKTMHRI